MKILDKKPPIFTSDTEIMEEYLLEKTLRKTEKCDKIEDKDKED